VIHKLVKRPPFARLFCGRSARWRHLKRGRFIHDQIMNLMMRTGLKRSGIQLASSGRWESALSVERMSPSAVNDWLAAAGKDVAVEALYVDGSGDLQGFIGFRRCLEAVEDRGVFWLKVLESSRTPKNPKDNMTEWLALIGQPSL
jgi:hypothetical protein